MVGVPALSDRRVAHGIWGKYVLCMDARPTAPVGRRKLLVIACEHFRNRFSRWLV